MHKYRLPLTLISYPSLLSPPSPWLEVWCPSWASIAKVQTLSGQVYHFSSYCLFPVAEQSVLSTGHNTANPLQCNSTQEWPRKTGQGHCSALGGEIPRSNSIPVIPLFLMWGSQSLSKVMLGFYTTPPESTLLLYLDDPLDDIVVWYCDYDFLSK